MYEDLHSAHIFLKYIVYMQDYLRWRLRCICCLEDCYLPALEIAVLLQPVEDLLEDRSQYSIILNTETDILHCDTETDIFCILKKLVYAHLKLALYSPWQRL